MLKRHNQSLKSQQSQRPLSGFSLIEILVVLMILGILTALILNSMGGLLGNAKIAATQVTIKQIDAVIQARYDAIRKADVSVEAKKLSALNSGVSKEEAEFLIRKALYRQALPQRPEDLHGLDMNPSTTGDNAPYYASFISNGGTAASIDYDLPTAPRKGVAGAEVFLYALLNGSSVRAYPGGKSYPVPLLELDNINQNHIADLDNDGLKELVDEWGFPFRFYNFPTRLIRDSSGTLNTSSARILVPGLSTNTSTTGPLAKDPLDPTGLLRSQFTSSSNLRYRPPNVTLNRAAFDEPNYHTANTHYFPLLVSIGPDSVLFADDGLGLGEPDFITVNSGVAERLAQIIDQDTMTSGVQITNPTSGETPIADNLTNRQQ